MGEVKGLGSTMPQVSTLVAGGRETSGERVDRAARDAGQSSSDRGDTVRLTGAASRLRELERSLAQVPVVDSGRVDGVRKALAESSYRISPQRIAERLIAFELGLGRVTGHAEGGSDRARGG